MRDIIIVVGSANIDMIVKSERFPQPGETLLGGDFYMLPGGKGANQAVAAARLGGNVNFMCRVGDDSFGRRSIRGYEKEGIITDHIIVDQERPTGVALISVNGAGENKIVVAPGANDGFAKKEIEESRTLFSGANIILLQLEIPIQTVGQILNFAKENKVRVIINPAPAQTLPAWFYKDLYLITPNEMETEQLTGIPITGNDTALEAGYWFKRSGVENIVITMGDTGAFMITDEYTGLIRAPEVNAEDTTAAGDVFNGALSVALTQNTSWQKAVRFACRAAALSVSKIGAQSSAPTQEEFRHFTAKFTENKESYS